MFELNSNSHNNASIRKVLSNISSESCGGKAAGLARLTDLLALVPPAAKVDFDIVVPKWTVITDDIFGAFCQENQIDIDASDPAFIQNMIKNGTWSAALKAHVYSILSANQIGTGPMAVRSSCNLEDAKNLSFAGMFSSLMPVDPAEILTAIQSCWLSFFSERVRSYLDANRSSHELLRVHVVVQEYVRSERSGVIFSRWADHRGQVDSLAIEGVYGMGEGLVGGYVDADHYQWNRQTGEWTSKIPSSRQMLVSANSSSQLVVPVPEAKAHLPVFSASELTTLSHLAQFIERTRGYPVDLEFSFLGDTLFLLQERPITTLPDLQTLESEFRRASVIWDNANIAESFPGLTKPLTYSHIRRAYAQVYRQFAGVMGVPEAFIQSHRSIFENMLGIINGRVYYNLLNWYRLIYLLPNAQRSQSFMEGMMGVSQSLAGDPEAYASMFSEVNSPQKTHHRLFACIKGAKQLLFASKNNRTFENRVGDKINTALEMDFSKVSIPELYAFYEAFSEDIIGDWRAPIVNDTRCMLYHGVLKAMIKKWLPTQTPDDLCNQLTKQDGTLFSMQFATVIAGIADDLRNGKISGVELFENHDAVLTWETIKSSSHADLTAALTQYLNEYGYRCAEELKFESLDLTDTPDQLVLSLANALRNTSKSAHHHVHSTAFESLDILPGVKRKLLKYVARLTAHAIDDRERLRYLRTKSFVVAKRIFRAMGRKLAAAGVLTSHEDIHWLTVDELKDFIKGSSIDSHLSHVTQKRKQSYDTYAKEPSPPDRFVTRGAVGLFSRYDNLIRSQISGKHNLDSANPNQLLGTPCSSGKVTGSVYVATCLADARGAPGKILVTERTDPGWVTAFPGCPGLIIEHGSLLSHSAIVAREMGIPTIVGVHDATKRLATGDRVELDGSAGSILKLC